MCVCVCVSAQSCPTLCDPMDYRPSSSSVHGIIPGKNTGVGCHSFLQGTFQTQGWTKPSSLASPELADRLFTTVSWCVCMHKSYKNIEKSHGLKMKWLYTLRMTARNTRRDIIMLFALERKRRAPQKDSGPLTMYLWLHDKQREVNIHTPHKH